MSGGRTLFERMSALSRGKAEPDKVCAVCGNVFPESKDGTMVQWFELGGIAVCSRACRATQWPDHPKEAGHAHRMPPLPPPSDVKSVKFETLPTPIDTSTLGPIRVDQRSALVWDNPKQCAEDLRRIAADVDQNGMATISPAKLLALAGLVERMPRPPSVDSCVSNF